MNSADKDYELALKFNNRDARISDSNCNNKYQTKDGDNEFKLNVRVGAHKHFRLTPDKLKEEYAALVDEFGDQLTEFDQEYDEGYDDYENEDEYLDEEYTDDEYSDYDDENEEYDEDTFGAIVGEEGDYYLIDDGEYYYDEDGNIEYEEYYDEIETDQDDDDDEEEEESEVESDAMDSFIDSDNELEWIVTNEVTNEYDMDWLDDNKWDEINTVITLNARTLKKKCMNIFGRKLCLCEFIGFVEHKSKKHVCHPGKYK
eukprot:335540_1